MNVLKGLRRESENLRPVIQNKEIGSVYVGGGTPSILPGDQLAAIFEIISENFRILPDAEITVEINPNSMSRALLRLLRNRGVNRLSVGVQSLSDDILGILGRAHTAKEAEESVRRARGIGFDNISIDLIYGIPGQDLLLWRESLLGALALGPDHLSVYSLSLDQGSEYARMAKQGKLKLPDEDLVAEMYDSSVETLRSWGYNQYELSNFARPGYECKHNGNYWERGEYIGIGPGAWSFLSGKRSCNIPDVAEYARRLTAGLSATVFEEMPTEEEAVREILFLGLRTAKGVDLHNVHQRHSGTAYKRFMINLERPQKEGLVRFSGGRLFLTSQGKLLADEVILMLCR